MIAVFITEMVILFKHVIIIIIIIIIIILTISLVFSVSYSVPKRKKKYKNNEDRSQAKGEASTLKTGKLRYHLSISTFLCLCIWRIARELNLSSVIVLHRGDFSLFMLLKLRSAVHVDTG